jgi:butyryl-CoA dehydrogenase
MMNEARIGIGLGAAAIAYQGFNHSLAYARTRPQGRLPSNKNPNSPQAMLVQHADVRRMLLAQKAYAEGGLAMCLFASSLFEDQHSAPRLEQRARAGLLLDLLTPIIKSWPSKYGCQANDLAIQVLGGYGYVREYEVERLYRDQRLNPIHEGTEAIHGLDLLGRKLPMKDRAGYRLFIEEVEKDLASADTLAATREFIAPLRNAMALLDRTTQSLLAQVGEDIDRGMANATIYLDLFGRVVAAWIWLKQAVKAAQGLAWSASEGGEFYQGKVHTARYYIEWELPVIESQARLLSSANTVPFTMRDEWF